MKPSSVKPPGPKEVKHILHTHLDGCNYADKVQRLNPRQGFETRFTDQTGLSGGGTNDKNPGQYLRAETREKDRMETVCTHGLRNSRIKLMGRNKEEGCIHTEINDVLFTN